MAGSLFRLYVYPLAFLDALGLPTRFKVALHTLSHGIIVEDGECQNCHSSTTFDSLCMSCFFSRGSSKLDAVKSSLGLCRDDKGAMHAGQLVAHIAHVGRGHKRLFL